MKIIKVEEWEQNHINALTLKLILAATVGTLAAVALAFILQKMGVPEIRPELLFAPWGIALVLGIASAFHRGVLAERARAEGKK
jgi:ABC-type phosphate/phosphonate transport system permease subunit